MTGQATDADLGNLLPAALITGNAGKAAEYAAMLGIDVGHRAYAQMTSEEKNKISHRRRAVEAMRTGLGLR